MDALPGRRHTRPSFADADPQHLHNLDSYLIAHTRPRQPQKPTPAPAKTTSNDADIETKKRKRREKALVKYKQQNAALKSHIATLESTLSSQLHQLRAVSNSLFDHLSELNNTPNPSHRMAVESL
ncbi:hypothetical protein H4R27_005132 [Coemansia aciculifera]|nr:hypothetical protein H4R27_005132 [Coemansia aciculifera]